MMQEPNPNALWGFRFSHAELKFVVWDSRLPKTRPKKDPKIRLCWCHRVEHATVLLNRSFFQAPNARLMTVRVFLFRSWGWWFFSMNWESQPPTKLMTFRLRAQHHYWCDLSDSGLSEADLLNVTDCSTSSLGGATVVRMSQSRTYWAYCRISWWVIILPFKWLFTIVGQIHIGTGFWSSRPKRQAQQQRRQGTSWKRKTFPPKVFWMAWIVPGTQLWSNTVCQCWWQW